MILATCQMTKKLVKTDKFLALLNNFNDYFWRKNKSTASQNEMYGVVLSILRIVDDPENDTPVTYWRQKKFLIRGIFQIMFLNCFEYLTMKTTIGQERGGGSKLNDALSTKSQGGGLKLNGVLSKLGIFNLVHFPTYISSLS